VELAINYRKLCHPTMRVFPHQRQNINTSKYSPKYVLSDYNSQKSVENIFLNFPMSHPWYDATRVRVARRERHKGKQCLLASDPK